MEKVEEHYRMLFEHMLAGFAHCEMLFDDNGTPIDFRYLEVNPMFEKLTGLQDVVGKSVTEVIPGIRQSDPKLFDICGRVALTGKSEQMEIYVEALKIWFAISVYSIEKGFFVTVFNNITEEKNKTAQLSKAFNELENIIDALPNVLYVLDTEANLIKWNRHAEVVTGYSADELKKKLVFELIAEPERPVLIEGINIAYDKGYSENTLSLVKKDGTQVPYRWSAAPMRDAQGNDIGIIGIGWDLTEQIKNEEALGQQEHLNDIVSNHLPIGYAVNTVSDGKAVFVNKKFEEIYGWPRDILTSVDAFFEHVYPDPAFRKKIKEQVMADIMSGDPVRMVWEKLPIVKQSGETAYITARNIPLPEYDAMVSTVLDVTHQVRVEKALRESHRLQRAILDNIPDMAWVKDKNGVILVVNAPFINAVHKPVESIIGKTDYDIWDDRTMADTFRADDAEVMASGKQMKKQEFMTVPGTDQKVFAETIKMPIYNEDGTIFGTTGIARIIDKPSV